MILLFHCNFNGRLEAFSEIADHNKLIRDFDKIKFCQDGLKILEIRCPISGLFYLILGVFPKLTPNIVNKGLKTSKVFLKIGFEVKLYDKSSVFMVALLLNFSEADGAIEKYGGKKGTIHFCDT